MLNISLKLHKKTVGGKLMFHRPLANFIATLGRILIEILGHCLIGYFD